MTMPIGVSRSQPSWEIGVSVWMHACFIAVMLLGKNCNFNSNRIEPAQVMMVQMAQLPRSETAMPDRPSRTPDPPPQAAPVPTPTPDPVPQPEPSDMQLNNPETQPEESPDNSDDRAELLNQARREQLLRDLSAPVGDIDRTATDPNGVDPSEAIMGHGVGTIDPELARYIQSCREAILPNWTPLPATVSAHPEYEVVIDVSVAADGTLGQPTVVKGTGDSSFDRTAVMAVLKTRQLPPPPAAWQASARRGVQITLSARDK